MKEYEKLLKSKRNFEFISITSLTWDKFPRGPNLNLNFDLNASEMHLRRLLDPVVNLETPAPQVLDAVADDFNDEPPLGAVLDEVDNDIDDEQPVGEVVVENDGGINVQAPLHEAHAHSVIRRRKSKKTEYSQKTLNKYSSEIERNIWSLIENKLVTVNEQLRNQLTKEVVARMNKKISNTVSSPDDADSRVVICSIKTLTEKMNKYGVNDREQKRFMSGIALAVCGGGLSVVKLQSITGLSRRILEQGNKMRTEFDSESSAAEVQEMAALLNPAHVDEIVEDDVDLLEHESDSENESDKDAPVAEAPGKRIRANRGEGIRRNRNRYSLYFSCKKRKTRCDAIKGAEVPMG